MRAPRWSPAAAWTSTPRRAVRSQIGQAILRAADVNVQVADINIGSTQALADFAPLLPQGLALDEAGLNTLAQGSAELSLTANEAVNIVGSVALDSGSTSLVLNTPAIYGYGITGHGRGDRSGRDLDHRAALHLERGRHGLRAADGQQYDRVGHAGRPARRQRGDGRRAPRRWRQAASLSIDATSATGLGTIVLGYGPGHAGG